MFLNVIMVIGCDVVGICFSFFALRFGLVGCVCVCVCVSGSVCWMDVLVTCVRVCVVRKPESEEFEFYS